MKKYIIYTRKSTESDDRQMLSLGSQIEECKRLAERKGLKVVKTFQESMSAKMPGRPHFNEMVEMLEKNEAQGIICWSVNRLSRNAKDGGTLQWLMDDSGVEIVSPDQTYDKENSSLLFKIATGQSEQYSKDLSKVVIRGNKTKFENGGWCGLATPGYLNAENKLTGEKTIIKDDDRFDLVRKMWDLALEGKSVPNIRKIATEQWGYKTRATRKREGCPISETSLYRIFRDPFYYGYLVRNVGGEVKKNWGSHTTMVSKQEFDKVQELLGFVHKPPLEHAWGTNGLIKCGECGRAITTEKHTKLYKSGARQSFVYARCTKRHTKCSQGYMRIEDLVEQIKEVLGQITISPKVVAVCIEYLKKENEKETDLQIGNKKVLQRRVNEIQLKEGRLLDLYLSPQSGMAEEDYQAKKKELAVEKEKAQERLDDLEYRSKHWFELAENTFDFAKNCLERFENGTPEVRHKILRIIGGSNLTLRDGKLNFIPVKPYYFIYKKPLLGTLCTNGGPGGDRTLDTGLKRPLLYH